MTSNFAFVMLRGASWCQLRAIYDRPPSMFESVGPEASRLATLGWVLTAVASVAFLVVMALIAAGLWRRRGVPNDDAPPPPVNDRAWVLVGGGLIPAIVLALVFMLTLGTHSALAHRSTSGERSFTRVEVIGHQWWWEVRYPDLGIVTADEVHIPVGRPVRVALRSGDVIHSFWIPNIAGKTDVIPGTHNDAWIEADSAGRWRGECAEYCGLQHANMALTVVSHDSGDFARWVERERAPAVQPTDSSEILGERVFLTAGCSYCHTVRGTQAGGQVAPDLTHIASRLTLAGATLPNTRGHLGGWIENPQRIKPGTKMPAFQLDGASLQSVLAWLESLR